jgi:hypothetical protein
MGLIIVFALGASVFPMLLACVAIIFSRPEPRLLLLAFYAGGLLTSLTTGLVVLRLFNDGQKALGSTKHAPHPANSIVIGLVALFFAWLMASERGNAIIDRWRARRARRRSEPSREAGASWAERRLGGASGKIAFVVGAAINLPGPLYLLAIGKISRGHYSAAGQIGLVLLFNAIMFLLLEAPLLGYLVRPEATTGRVKAMSQLLNANGLRVTGLLVAVFGAGLVAQGIAALSG